MLSRSKHDYHNFVFSMKASNPLVMVQAYRLLAAEQYRSVHDLFVILAEPLKRSMYKVVYKVGVTARTNIFVTHFRVKCMPPLKTNPEASRGAPESWEFWLV